MCPQSHSFKPAFSWSSKYESIMMGHDEFTDGDVVKNIQVRVLWQVLTSHLVEREGKSNPTHDGLLKIWKEVYLEKRSSAEWLELLGSYQAIPNKNKE